MGILMGEWEERSRDFIGNFIGAFGEEGRLTQMVLEGRDRVVRAISPTREINDSGIHENFGSDDEESGTSPSSSPPQSPKHQVKRSRLLDHKDFSDDDDEVDSEIQSLTRGRLTRSRKQ